jgi:hypothetical protein
MSGALAYRVHMNLLYKMLEKQNLKMSKHSGIKFRVYIWTFYIRPQVSGEINILCGLYKKDKKKCLVNSHVLNSKNCLFYMGDKKCSFFPKTCVQT